MPWSKCTSKESGPRRWSCPTNSENSLGRRRSASGVVTPVSMILIFYRLGGRSLERSCIGVFKSLASSGRESELWEDDGSIVGRFLVWLNIGAIDFKSSVFLENEEIFDDVQAAASEFESEKTPPWLQLESKCRFISNSTTRTLQIGHCNVITPVKKKVN